MQYLTIKTKLTTILLLSLLSLPVLACKRESEQEYFSQIAELLNLTESQIQPVRLILTEQKVAHREAGRGSIELHKTIALEGKDKLSEILDETQLLQFEAYMKGAKHGRGPC